MQQKSSRKKLPVAVYTSKSQIRNPARLVKQMWRDLLASRELAWRLMIRDISAKYRQSLLGLVWAFIPPIVMAAGFTIAKGSGVVNLGATSLPYPAYVMFSMSLWQTFTEAITAPVQGITQGKQMLVKINFPREAIILGKLGEVFFNFGIKLILIVGLFIWFKIPVSWSLILAPVALIHLIMLGTAIGLFLSPLGALYQDISLGITFATSFWLFLTPVVYPVPGEGLFGTIVKLNPVTPLLVTIRDLATIGEVSEPVGFWVASAIAIVGLVLGWLFYRLAMPFVIERMSS